jgi:KDO2-lipid IV(A) lauroyltransferase
MIVFAYILQAILRPTFWLPAGFAVACLRFFARLIQVIVKISPLRREIEANIKLVLPGAPARQIANKLIDNYSYSIMEVLCIPFFKKKHFARCFKAEKTENIKKGLAAGRGAIILTIHAGNFELAPINIKNAGFSIIGVMRATDDPIFEFIQSCRIVQDIPMVNVDNQDMFKAAVKALSENKLVYLFADTGALESRNETISLFGHNVPVATGWITLAQRSNCAVIPILSRRENKVNIYSFAEPIFVAKDNRAEVIQKVGAIFEQYIKEHPDQWAMFFNSYETKRMLEGK